MIPSVIEIDSSLSRVFLVNFCSVVARAGVRADFGGSGRKMGGMRENIMKRERMRQAALTEETNRSRPLQNSCAAAKEPPTSSSTPFSTPPVLSPFLLLVSSLSPLLLLLFLPPPPFLVYKTQVERVIRRRNVFIRSLRNKSKFLISLSYELQRHWSTRICSLLGVQHGADAGRGKKSRLVVIIYYYYYYYLLYLFLVQEEMKGKKQKKKSFLLLLLFKRKDGHRRLGPFFHARFHAVRRAI